MPPKGNKPSCDGNQTQSKKYDDRIKMLEEKMKMMEITFNSKLDALYKVIDQKDEVIGKLNRDIGELNKSYDFLSKETSDIKSSLNEHSDYTENSFRNTDKYLSAIKSKTVDLEDRSRRCNLVFYNFAEASHGTDENCESKVEDLIESFNIFPHDEQIWIERAHRLGKRTPECDTKPRPVIVKFAYYKQKQTIIFNGAKFKNTHINVSEDFSRETIEVHKKLRHYGKIAKDNFTDPVKQLIGYKVTYRRLLVTYSVNSNDSNSRKFTKSFNLDYIMKNPNWFKPQVRILDSD